VDGEAIRSLIHAILPSFRLICDTVSTNGAVFS
jgi:hypothetical protein